MGLLCYLYHMNQDQRRNLMERKVELTNRNPSEGFVVTRAALYPPYIHPPYLHTHLLAGLLGCTPLEGATQVGAGVGVQ